MSIKFVTYNKRLVWNVPANKVVSGSIELVEEDISSFQFELNTAGCCDDVAKLFPWNTWVSFEDEYNRFFGVVSSMRDNRGRILVTCHEKSIFWKLAAMSAMGFDGEDVSEVIAILANLPFIDGEGFDIVSNVVGVSIERSWLDQYVYVWDAIQDLVKSGVSYYVWGNTLNIYSSIYNSSRVKTLYAKDFAVSPEIIFDGLSMVDKVVINGVEQAIVESDNSLYDYGVGTFLKEPLTKIVADNNLKSVKDGVAIGQNILDAARFPFKVNNLSEVPLRSCVNVEDFLPSTVVNIELDGYCLPANTQYRVFKSVYDIKDQKLRIVLKSLGEAVEIGGV